MSLHPSSDPTRVDLLRIAADPSDDASPDTTSRRLGAFVFVAIAALVGADVVGDLASGAGWTHVGLELVVFLLAVAGLIVLTREVLVARVRARSLSRALEAARHDAARLAEDAARYRAEAQSHLAGLAQAIDRQLETWGLSPAEREIALLILKGLALKEIATARGTSERTVRQQARAVYEKAGVAGRAELSAFFLEDLLVP